MSGLRRGADYLYYGAGAMLIDAATWLRPGGAGLTLKRWTGLATIGPFFAYLLFMTPWLMWPLSVVSVIAAGMRGRVLLLEAEQEQAERVDDAEFVQLIAATMGPRNGVLLADVLAELHALDRVPNASVTDLREACERLGIRVRKTLAVEGRRSVGVHRDDLYAVYRPATPLPPGFRPSDGSSAGQDATTSTVPIGGGGVAWSVHGSVPEPQRDDFEDHLADALALLDEEVNEA